MQTRSPQKISLTSPGIYSLLLALGWTSVIAISLLASSSAVQQEIVTIAKNVARAYIDKDILYRNWNAFHGGIYMLAGRGIQPNPYYPPSVLEREVITPSGRQLILVNPAYMTRQIYDFAQKQHRVSGRITSLKPLRPENKADDWEAAALRDFERGELEVSSMVREGGIGYVRLMRPLVTEESCLTCHAQQGYRKGDIRGGISIKLPMDLLESAMRRQLELLGVGHGAMWLLGVSGLYAGYTGLRRRTKERDLAEEELKRVNAILDNQAMTDSLTGIFNRRKFSILLKAQIQESRRYGMPLALIFLDVDHFKTINDTHGHEAGDVVLQELARLVSGTIRQTDIFARFGGEEFVILAHNNDVNTGRELAEKIRSRVSQHSFTRIGAVTCSFGVAQLCPDDTAETVIKRADGAMYAAKKGGRNRIETRCAGRG